MIDATGVISWSPLKEAAFRSCKSNQKLVYITDSVNLVVHRMQCVPHPPQSLDACMQCVHVSCRVTWAGCITRRQAQQHLFSSLPTCTIRSSLTRPSQRQLPTGTRRPLTPQSVRARVSFTFDTCPTESVRH